MVAEKRVLNFVSDLKISRIKRVLNFPEISFVIKHFIVSTEN
jgi:hypothetical protein